MKKLMNLQAYDQRVNKGMLPTIKIAEHIFYVDIRMDMLRPKDDFLSKGIVFKDISKYYDHKDETYTIPYNPNTHEFEEPDYQNITNLPTDLIVVKFLSEKILDSIGWNRKNGLDQAYGLREKDLKLNFSAELIPWEKTFLYDLVKINIKEQNTLSKSTQKGRKI